MSTLLGWVSIFFMPWFSGSLFYAIYPMTDIELFSVELSWWFISCYVKCSFCNICFVFDLNKVLKLDQLKIDMHEITWHVIFILLIQIWSMSLSMLGWWLSWFSHDVNVIKATMIPYLIYETDQIVKVIREIAFRCAHKVYKMWLCYC